MANNSFEMILTIKDKADKENYNISKALYEKHYHDLTKNELFKYKIIFSNEELDFVINNYQKKLETNDFLASCIYLLNEYKQTKQLSKCTALYNLLNQYFTIRNCYDDPYSEYREWEGFKLVAFVECPAILQELIKEKAVKLKSEKEKQARIDCIKKADKSVKEIIDELEL